MSFSDWGLGNVEEANEKLKTIFGVPTNKNTELTVDELMVKQTGLQNQKEIFNMNESLQID